MSGEVEIKGGLVDATLKVFNAQMAQVIDERDRLQIELETARKNLEAMAPVIDERDDLHAELEALIRGVQCALFGSPSLATTQETIDDVHEAVQRRDELKREVGRMKGELASDAAKIATLAKGQTEWRERAIDLQRKLDATTLMLAQAHEALLDVAYAANFAAVVGRFLTDDESLAADKPNESKLQSGQDRPSAHQFLDSLPEPSSSALAMPLDEDDTAKGDEKPATPEDETVEALRKCTIAEGWVLEAIWGRYGDLEEQIARKDAALRECWSLLRTIDRVVSIDTDREVLDAIKRMYALLTPSIGATAPRSDNKKAGAK